MKTFREFLTEKKQKVDIGLPFKIEVGLAKDYDINMVYRTERAHGSYKGKTSWGKGVYFTLNKEDAKEYTLDPNASKIEYYDPKIHGEIDRYSVLRNMRIAHFNVDNNEGFEHMEYINKKSKGDIKTFFIENNIHALYIESESMNYGGNQLVVFDMKWIR